MTRPLSILAALMMGGCAGVSHIIQTYSSVSPVDVPTSADNWQVFDRPDLGRIMVNPSLGSALVTGVTLYQGVAPKPMAQEAAESYLKNTGRTCTVTDGYIVQSPQWEFKYSCG